MATPTKSTVIAHIHSSTIGQQLGKPVGVLTFNKVEIEVSYLRSICQRFYSTVFYIGISRTVAGST